MLVKTTGELQNCGGVALKKFSMLERGFNNRYGQFSEVQ
jgi:hypothetical protein